MSSRRDFLRSVAVASPVLAAATASPARAGGGGSGTFCETFQEIVDRLAELEIVGGGVLEIGEVEIEFPESAFIPSNVTVRGRDRATVLRQSHTDLELFVMQGVSNAGVERLRIVGNGTFDTKGFGAIRVGLGSTNNGADSCWASRVWLDGAGNSGVTVGSESTDTTISHCRIVGCGEEGAYMLGADSIIESCVLVDNGQAGVKARGARATVRDNLCRGNGQYGVLMTNDVVGGMTIGNTIAGSGFDGIRVAGNAKDHSIVGNTIASSGQEQANRANIHLQGSSIERMSIRGNVCRLGDYPNSPKWGLRIHSSATDTLVGHNDLRDSGTQSDYSDQGVGTVVQ